MRIKNEVRHSDPCLTNLYVRNAINKVKYRTEVCIGINGEIMNIVKFLHEIVVIIDK